MWSELGVGDVGAWGMLAGAGWGMAHVGACITGQRVWGMGVGAWGMLGQVGAWRMLGHAPRGNGHGVVTVLCLVEAKDRLVPSKLIT